MSYRYKNPVTGKIGVLMIQTPIVWLATGLVAQEREDKSLNYFIKVATAHYFDGLKDFCYAVEQRMCKLVEDAKTQWLPNNQSDCASLMIKVY
jgi:hypothetical protein